MFSWADPPSTGHPGHEFGCRCWAEPILEDAGEPVQVALAPALLTAPEAIAAGKAIIAAAGAALGITTGVVVSEELSDDDNDTEESNPDDNQPLVESTPDAPEPEDDGPEDEELEESQGESAPEGGREDIEWEFDKNKSTTKWENQKKARGWTDKEITEAIKKGDAFPTKNKRTDGPATLYKYKDKYVVRDNKTKEIIQIGGKGFKHPDLP